MEKAQTPEFTIWIRIEEGQLKVTGQGGLDPFRVIFAVELWKRQFFDELHGQTSITKPSTTPVM